MHKAKADLCFPYPTILWPVAAPQKIAQMISPRCQITGTQCSITEFLYTWDHTTTHIKGCTLTSKMALFLLRQIVTLQMENT
jgi:hypothetical protein